MRTFEITPGHHTPDSRRGSAKPLSLSKAFTMPPHAPAIAINEAHTHGFMPFSSETNYIYFDVLAGYRQPPLWPNAGPCEPSKWVSSATFLKLCEYWASHVAKADCRNQTPKRLLTALETALALLQKSVTQDARRFYILSE